LEREELWLIFCGGATLAAWPIAEFKTPEADRLIDMNNNPIICFARV
jgi:hypothetical protein